MQSAWAGVGEEAQLVVLPQHDIEVISGVPWGTPDAINTPAYWAVRCRWGADSIPDFVSRTTPLIEEVGFCLLGGFGVKYEVNVAAFKRMQQHKVFDLDIEVPLEEIRELLLFPLQVGSRKLRYRFPNQRADRLFEMRSKLISDEWEQLDPLCLRTRLMKITGIGPKTASWIVRNHLGCDDVAILDVHVIRACMEMRVFPGRCILPKDYEALERRFLDFARAIDVRPSVLDAVIWTECRGGSHSEARHQS